jgi:catalase
VLLALPALAPTLALRSSYAGITYYGIHAFRWLDAEGHVTNVRYVLGPAAPAAKLSAKAAKQGGPDYLQHELRDRLATGPARFTLSLIIGEVGDPTDDPSAAWPASRRRVSAGQLTLEAIDGERDTGDDVLVFDPTRVVDGIECSDDPVLKFRGAAYTESVARRMRSS